MIVRRASVLLSYSFGKIRSHLEQSCTYIYIYLLRIVGVPTNRASYEYFVGLAQPGVVERWFVFSFFCFFVVCKILF